MSIASTLLEQTEVLQARLDNANAKHLAESDPHNHNRRDALRDGGETLPLLTVGNWFPEPEPEPTVERPSLDPVPRIDHN